MIVEKEWLMTEKMRSNIRIDKYIVMPNHFHGIIIINADCRGGVTPPLRKYTLGQIVAYFKYQTTKQINQTRGTPGISLWQRNYYEHIIRNEKELDNICRYIEGNPVLWEYDHENPGRLHEIDRVLAEHYGFTDEELDFIINYDIKYRMGREGLENDAD